MKLSFDKLPMLSFTIEIQSLNSIFNSFLRLLEKSPISILVLGLKPYISPDSIMSIRKDNIIIGRSSSTSDLESLENDSFSNRRMLARSASSTNLSKDVKPSNAIYKYSLFSVIESKDAIKTPTVSPSLFLSDEPLSSYMPYLNRIKESYETLLKLRKMSCQTEDDIVLASEKKDIKEGVPKLFFDPEFDISQQSTFYKVYRDDDESTITIQQLEDHLAFVEGELSDRLNKRSESFFKAFEDLQNLYSTVKDTFSKSEGLKLTLNTAHEMLVQQNLIIVQKQSRKDNLRVVQDKLKTLSKITKVLPLIKQHIKDEDLHTALAYISQVQIILDTKLCGIDCVRDIQKKLDKMNEEIDQKFVQSFVVHACGEGPLTNESKSKLDPIIIELMNAGKMPSTLDSYLEIQERTIEEIFTNVWLEGEKKMKIDEAAAAVESDAFIVKLRILYAKLTKQSVRSKSLRDFMEQVFKRIDNEQKIDFQNKDNTNGSEIAAQKLVEEQQIRMKILIDFENIQAQASSQLINTRISKIFNARTEWNKKLNQNNFATLYSITQRFIADSEMTTHRENQLRLTITTLKNVFLEANHANKISKITGILENETWFRAEIVKEFVLILNCLLRPEIPLELDENDKGDNVKDINVDGERYLLVNSTLLFSKMLYDYLLILESTPSIYKDVIEKIIDLLQVFQKNIHELILERRAVKISTLKSISATHLALAWQNLSLLSVIIPRMKDRILTLVNNQDLDEDAFKPFDHVLNDYLTHREKVISKIVSLMSDRLDILFKGFKIDEHSTEPGRPFTMLADKTKVLHKILKAILHTQYFQITFKQILLLYNYKLVNIFSNLTIKTPKEKQKLLNDVYYFLEKIRELPGIGDPTDEIAEYVHANVK